MQLVGRLLVGSQSDQTVLLLIIGLQELVNRVTFLPCHALFQRMRGRTHVPIEEKANFLAVVCIDNVASMCSEITAIIIVAGARLMFFKHRALFDLGYSECDPQEDAFGREMGNMLKALAVEIVVDVAAMTVQSRQG